MIVHQDYHRDGRVQRYVRALTESRAHVDVICTKPAGSMVRDDVERLRIFPIALCHRSGRIRRYLWEYVIGLALYTFKLLALYVVRRYHIIHVHNMPDFLVLATVLPRLLGAKVILDIHDPMPEFYVSRFGAGRQSTLARLLEWQEKLAARLSDKIITANSNFKANLTRRGLDESTITVINNVADINIFDRRKRRSLPNAHSDEFVLIYPGTIAPRYGLDIAIQALPFLVDSIPEIRLRIIGVHSQHVQELNRLALELGVSHLVRIEDAIPVEEVPDQLALADVGVYPARPDAHMSIATPTKVLEYAAMGLPILASRITILEQLFSSEAIMFFEPGDVNDFAQCVLELFRNPLARRRLVKTMDETFLQQYSWDVERSRYLALVTRLLPEQA